MSVSATLLQIEILKILFVSNDIAITSEDALFLRVSKIFA